MKTPRKKKVRPAKSATPSKASELQDAAGGNTDADRRRLDPKLQMVHNCDPDINHVMAELSAWVFLTTPDASIPEMRGPDSIPQFIRFVEDIEAKRDLRPGSRSRM